MPSISYSEESSTLPIEPASVYFAPRSQTAQGVFRACVESFQSATQTPTLDAIVGVNHTIPSEATATVSGESPFRWYTSAFANKDWVSVANRSSEATHPDRSTKYSWARRIDDIALNRDGDGPKVSAFAMHVARRLAFYSESRARAYGIGVLPIISPIDEKRMQIEWNRRGKAIHHLECTISDDVGEFLSLLSTTESVRGVVLRASEINRATMHEVFAAIEALISRNVS